jgi:hypothetical protein
MLHEEQRTMGVLPGDLESQRAESHRYRSASPILPRRNKLRFSRRYLDLLRSLFACRLHRQQRKRSKRLAEFAPFQPVGHLTSLVSEVPAA